MQSAWHAAAVGPAACADEHTSARSWTCSCSKALCAAQLPLSGTLNDMRVSEGCLEQTLNICMRKGDERLAEAVWEMLNINLTGGRTQQRAWPQETMDWLNQAAVQSHQWCQWQLAPASLAALQWPTTLSGCPTGPV